LAVLAPAAEIRHRVQAAHLHPGEHRRAESRRQRDVETAVPVEERWRAGITLQSLLAAQKYGDLRPILARVEDLGRLEFVRVELELGPSPDRARARRDVIAVDRRRVGKRGERVERLLVGALAREARGRAQAG